MWNLTVVLCLLWAVTLLYGEMFSFWLPSVWTCSWPHLRHRSSSSSTVSGVEHSGDYIKVAVLTDPQVMDRTTLRLPPKSLRLEIAKFYTDLFMRRSVLGSVLPFQPDVILFLGDYFDGGPILSDEEWQESASRFKHMFNLNTLETSTNIPVYYLPGNHDIGYSAFSPRMPKAIARYEKEFGPRNYQFTVGNVDFIAVDAQALDGNPEGNLTSTTWNFIETVSKNTSSSPRVLLTHIPLYRPDGTSCGLKRSSPIINQRVVRAGKSQEIIYQNYVTEEKSKNLLDMVKPVLVLSGHDHDQCTVTHESKHGAVKEHTVGTISWQQGNLYPSFMLLSASSRPLQNISSPGDEVLTELCFLPPQTHIYMWYLSQFVITLLILLFWPPNGIGISHHFDGLVESMRSLLSCSIFGGATKEKNEDENCEYEMVWDAEGSMHLIKKTSNSPAKLSSERGSVERGNAVSRPAVKKLISQETDAASVSLDVNEPVGLDPTMKLSSRSQKSIAKLAIRRLIRTVRILTFIAAANVPLYMMLLFKDWIDK